MPGSFFFVQSSGKIFGISFGITFAVVEETLYFYYIIGEFQMFQ